METRLFENSTSEVRKERAFLEKKLDVKIKISGKNVTVEGESLNEYEADKVMEAIDFGFPADVAILLKNEDVDFKKINIKGFTRRKNLTEVKARVIGTQGRTKRTIENIANCRLIIRGNQVGIIGEATEIEYAITALANLIRGSKQSNVYNFLERINTQKKELN